MKEELDTIIDENKSQLFCFYCAGKKNNKDICCKESDFIPLSDFDSITQRQVAQEIFNGYHTA